MKYEIRNERQSVMYDVRCVMYDVKTVCTMYGV
jgi:hypothetical protein